MQHREKKSNEPIWHGNWLGDLNQPPIHYEILTGPEDRGSHDDAEFFHMSHNIFHEIDEMMKHMFSGFGRLGVEESFSNAENYEGFKFFQPQHKKVATFFSHTGSFLVQHSSEYENVR